MLQEGEHVEVAIAFGGLRPELAGDLDDRLHAQAVDLDGVDAVAAGMQRIDVFLAIEIVSDLAQGAADARDFLVLFKIRLGPRWRGIHDVPALAVAQRVGQRLYGVADYLVRLTLVHLKGTDLIDQLVDHVAEVERIEHAHTEIDRELQAGLAARRFDAVSLLEEQNAESVEACILQREAILGLVHAEAARAAGACCEEDVIVDDLLLRQSLLFEALQVAHQIADGEIRRVALAIISKFFPCLKIGHDGRRNIFTAIAAAMKDRLNHLLVLPSKAAEKDRDIVTFARREGAFDRLLKLAHARQSRLRAEPRTFRIDTGLNLYFKIGLDDFCCWHMPLL